VTTVLLPAVWVLRVRRPVPDEYLAALVASPFGMLATWTNNRNAAVQFAARGAARAAARCWSAEQRKRLGIRVVRVVRTRRERG